jgi:hypothetical protein
LPCSLPSTTEHTPAVRRGLNNRFDHAFDPDRKPIVDAVRLSIVRVPSRRPQGAPDRRLRAAHSGCVGAVLVSAARARDYQPTLPSTSSRMRSACPLWRAYSSIMCA